MTSNILESAANTIAEKTAENLFEMAKKQLDNLFAQKTIYVEMKSSLDIIIKRYDINKSYLSIAADWYGSKSWWSKLEINLLLVSASTLAGAAFGLGVLLAGISISLNYIASFILLNHYQATSSQKSLLAEDITSMEEHLNEAINAFNLAGKELNETLKILCNLNIRLSKNASEFESEIETLKTQIQAFITTIENMEVLTNNLLATQGKISESVQKTSEDIQTINKHFEEQDTHIDDIENELAKGIENTGSNVNTLTTVTLNFQESLNKLDSLEQLVMQYLKKLEQSEDPVPEMENDQSETNQVLSRAEQILKKSNDYFSAQDSSPTPIGFFSQGRNTKKTTQETLSPNLSNPDT